VANLTALIANLHRHKLAKPAPRAAPRFERIVQLIYKKFVHKDRTPDAPTEVLSPETVELPLERGLAVPGMLADSIVRRWQDQDLQRLGGARQERV
jgi:hypothetical protein